MAKRRSKVGSTLRVAKGAGNKPSYPKYSSPGGIVVPHHANQIDVTVIRRNVVAKPDNRKSRWSDVCPLGRIS